MTVTRVVVVGGGIVGAACAYYVATAGLDVCILERKGVAAGTTGAGEGNLLLSDKGAGAELSMALRSMRLWGNLADEFGDSFELERKGGLVVATTDEALRASCAFAAEQEQAGVDSEVLDAQQLRDVEPHLVRGVVGGVRYPGDWQVQPMLAAARMLQDAGRAGANLRVGVEVTGLRMSRDRVSGVVTDEGVEPADYVVNATGPWAGQLSERLGAPIPVSPRRGFVLVTEPLPQVVRHKVLSADYVANVASNNAALETSAVIEGTRSGTVLVGASRERVGFDQKLSVPIVRRLAARAIELFPTLAKVNLLRVYSGFRPYCPDHLPIVGHDERMPGLLHACGHEGAGIGLAPATGELITQLILEQPTIVDPKPFSPTRLTGQSA